MVERQGAGRAGVPQDRFAGIRTTEAGSWQAGFQLSRSFAVLRMTTTWGGADDEKGVRSAMRGPTTSVIRRGPGGSRLRSARARERRRERKLLTACTHGFHLNSVCAHRVSIPTMRFTGQTRVMPLSMVRSPAAMVASPAALPRRPPRKA
jgi:hypothetical protein